jgi:phosphorylated CTD-interacting factor 1
LPPWAPLPALGCTPRAADVAAALEALRADKLELLRGVLGALCEASPLDAPPPQLSFERWRFGCAMHAEQAAAAVRPAAAAAAAGGATAGEESSKKKKKKKKKRPRSGTGQSAEPVVPSGGGDGGGLVADLVRAGLPEAEASTLAAALDTAAQAAASDVRREAARYDTGAVVAAALAPSVSFHKHSIDLTMGKHFVKLTREAYGKICELHRQHAPANERVPPLSAKTHGYEGAEADLAEAEIGTKSAKGGKGKAAAAAGGGGGPSRAALHARLFALLLRYKSLHGAGFQAACPPAVFSLLRERLGVAFEGFASPLNCHFPRHCSAFPVCLRSHPFIQPNCLRSTSTSF